MISAQFVTDDGFCGQYKRNNKAKGVKNLRCFPDCRATGHVKTGYCGRSIECKITYDAASTQNLDILAFCELRSRFTGGIQPPGEMVPVEGVALGEVFSLNDILSRKTRGFGNNPGERALNPWFPGSVLKSDQDPETGKIETIFSFNKANQGWHYGHNTTTMRTVKHELHIFVLAGSKQAGGIFTSVCEISSPPFTIHCRRKATDRKDGAAHEKHTKRTSLTSMIRPEATSGVSTKLDQNKDGPFGFVPRDLAAQGIKRSASPEEPTLAVARKRPAPGFVNHLCGTAINMASTRLPSTATTHLLQTNSIAAVKDFSSYIPPQNLQQHGQLGYTGYAYPDEIAQRIQQLEEQKRQLLALPHQQKATHVYVPPAHSAAMSALLSMAGSAQFCQPIGLDRCVSVGGSVAAVAAGGPVDVLTAAPKGAAEVKVQ
jgi:hypothetical protein